MTKEWPPPADAVGQSLLADVDTTEMPHAKHFAACLESLAGSDDFHGPVPFVGSISGREFEVHNRGIFKKSYQPSTIPVAVADHYSETPPEDCQFVSTVIEHLGTTPEHFMAFAQVLSGQHVARSDSGYVGGDNYETPVDRSYFYLASFKVSESGTPEGDVEAALADYSKLNSALQDVVEAKWESDAKVAAMTKFTHLMNYLLHFRGPLYAEFGATLVVYAMLIESARKRMDGLMAQAAAAMRGLEDVESSTIETLATLLALAGFIPALPYALTFGIGAMAMVVSEIEKASGAAKPEKITVPGNRSNSCVDILRWYLDEARATCESLADGIKSLSARLPAMFGDVRDAAAAKKVHIPDELTALLP